MVFHSANFLIFFIGLLVVFFTFRRGRLLILAIGNAIFYGAAGFSLLVVFFAVSLATYGAALMMHRPRLRWLFHAGIAVNLLNLGFFKYTLFVADTVQSVFDWFGVSVPIFEWVPAEIILPVGISFYTFQLISYLIDVRRGELEPTRSFLKFWVFISLFPQLVAGPIMRGSELLPQLDDLDRKQVRWEQIKFGLYLIVIGLIKKVVFADTIAQYVNPLFEKGLEMSAVEAWWAAYLFGFQIYFDFSAYSDMALGLGWMLGIELVVNFRTPYVSANPKEFWSRWHISLSRWIRDYIYIPLGGNRRGRLRTQFNLLAAMMLSGLWHGAMWTFVVWGAVHGVLQIIHRWSLELNRFGVIERVRRSLPYRIIAVFVFYHIITWTWVFFRAQSMTLAWDMTVKMWTVSWPELFTSTPMFAIAALYLLHLLEFGLRGREETVSRVWHAVPFPLRSACYFAIVLLLFYFLKGETYEFIYFQF